MNPQQRAAHASFLIALLFKLKKRTEKASSTPPLHRGKPSKMPSDRRSRSPKIKRGYLDCPRSVECCRQYCDDLGLSEKVAILSTEMAEEMAAKDYYAGHRQRAMTAACIFAAASLEGDGDRLNMSRLMDVVRVTKRDSMWVKDVWEFWEAYRVVWENRHFLDAVECSRMDFLVDPDFEI